MNWRRYFLKLLASFAISTKLSHADWLLPDIESAEPKIVDTDKITIKLPKIAEKNSAIAITISSELNDIHTLSILLDKPNQPLMAKFNLTPQLDVFVSTRVTVTEDATLVVLAQTPSVIYRTKALIKIGIAGCL